MWVKLLLLLLFGLMVLGAVHFARPAQPAFSSSSTNITNSLRLLTWNIGYAELEDDTRAHDKDLPAVANVILRQDPDAVALQELTGSAQLHVLLGLLQGKYRGAVAQQGRGDRFEAVLVKDPGAKFTPVAAGGRYALAASFRPRADTPEVLIILDEPTNGLDPQGIHETRELIRRLRDELKLTVLLSSHLLTEIEQLCNRVGIIHEGRLLYEGGPETLVANTNLYKVRVDNFAGAFELLTKDLGLTVSRNGSSFLRLDADAEQLAAANALLVGNGIKVYELSPAQESLEDAFLRLTKTATPRGLNSNGVREL